jgi:hypothetical protein
MMRYIAAFLGVMLIYLSLCFTDRVVLNQPIEREWNLIMAFGGIIIQLLTLERPKE